MTRECIIYSDQLGNITRCYIRLFIDKEIIVNLHSDTQIIITKGLPQFKEKNQYKVHTNGITLYCDKIVIDGKKFNFKKNQIILNFGNFGEEKSVDSPITLEI